MATSYNEAKNAYNKFIKESKVGFLGFYFSRSGELKNFLEAQKENGAYTGSYTGIKDVPIEKIRGSVQKYMDFDKNFVPKNEVIEDRWCRVYMGFCDGVSIPPVQLYKIKDDYFVYDGNHRVSVANFLNFKNIEAEVTEFVPSFDTKENVIYRERFMFEKITGLENISFTEVNQYNRIIKEIEDYVIYLKEKEEKDVNILDGAAIWYEKIYIPSIKIFEENHIIENFDGRTLSDLFIYFLDHKYFESERKGHDVGFSYAIIDFINLTKTYKDNSLENKIELNSEVKENLITLQSVDKRRYLDPEILRKNDIMTEITGLKFDHNFLILFEIDEYMAKAGIEDFEEGVKKWYEDEFLGKIDKLSEKIARLPLKYRNELEIVLEDKERLYYSIQNYSLFYKKYENEEPGYMEIVANYIIEIYLPIIDIIEAKKHESEWQKKEIKDIYFGIQGKYNYLKEYKIDTVMEDAAGLYFKSENKKEQKIHDWFLLKFSNTPKSELLIDYMLGKFRMQIKNKEILEEIINKYGKPKKYGSIFKLQKAKENFEQHVDEKLDWLRDRVKMDLEKIVQQEEIMTFFKTQSVMEKLKEDDEELSLIDFYADIVAYGNYLGKDLSYCDIIDLALEYRNR